MVFLIPALVSKAFEQFRDLHVVIVSLVMERQALCREINNDFLRL
jgi:hypothetical protein